jgi:CDP-paratose 2-epimerase
MRFTKLFIKMSNILITGGAGFIGVNAALHFAKNGWKVTVLDNLSRKGSKKNLQWLTNQVPVAFERIDIRDLEETERIVGNFRPDVLLHLAAQVAVTISVENPREDFEINAMGTFNVLEAVRKHSQNTFFINASTNKVYGKMDDVAVEEQNGRYRYVKLQFGVGEDRNLDFHSPYGCSKGIADQYTIDYSRIYGLKTVTFRQSCIYGPRQFGIEDQGWVAWFTIASVLGKPITIYGDGKQIRDVLHVDDLLCAFDAAIERKEIVNSQAFNIGGGPNNTMSLIELLGYLEKELDKKISFKWDNWRPGDQKVFVCDINKAKKFMNWSPTIHVKHGVKQLISWVKKNRDLFDF